MSRNKWIRENHRRLSVVFTVLVVANIVINVAASGQEELALVVGLATLLPLVLLMVTGLYLFALPYTARRRGERGTD